MKFQRTHSSKVLARAEKDGCNLKIHSVPATLREASSAARAVARSRREHSHLFSLGKRSIMPTHLLHSDLNIAKLLPEYLAIFAFQC